MSRQRMGLLGTLATVGVVGAAAGLAWRWAQRHRGAGVGLPRDLSRWEGEGGSVSNSGESAALNSETPGGSAPAVSAATRPVSTEAQTATMEGAWPFPSSTRH